MLSSKEYDLSRIGSWLDLQYLIEWCWLTWLKNDKFGYDNNI